MQSSHRRCPVCGDPAPTPRSVYCSPADRQKAYRYRHTAEGPPTACPHCGHPLTVRQLLATMRGGVTRHVARIRVQPVIAEMGPAPAASQRQPGTKRSPKRLLGRLLAAALLPLVLLSLTLAAARASDHHATHVSGAGASLSQPTVVGSLRARRPTQ